MEKFLIPDFDKFYPRTEKANDSEPEDDIPICVNPQEPELRSNSPEQDAEIVADADDEISVPTRMNPLLFITSGETTVSNSWNDDSYQSDTETLVGELDDTAEVADFDDAGSAEDERTEGNVSPAEAEDNVVMPRRPYRSHNSLPRKWRLASIKPQNLLLGSFSQDLSQDDIQPNRSRMHDDNQDAAYDGTHDGY